VEAVAGPAGGEDEGTAESLGADRDRPPVRAGVAGEDEAGGGAEDGILRGGAGKLNAQLNHGGTQGHEGPRNCIVKPENERGKGPTGERTRERRGFVVRLAPAGKPSWPWAGCGVGAGLKPAPTTPAWASLNDHLHLDVADLDD